MNAQVDSLALGRVTDRIWSEGRANPIGWVITTHLGSFTTSDRATWRSDGGRWTAELRRSRHGRHAYLALFEHGVYRGRYDNRGWHDASNRIRVRQLRSYQLPLAA